MKNNPCQPRKRNQTRPQLQKPHEQNNEDMIVKVPKGRVDVVGDFIADLWEVMNPEMMYRLENVLIEDMGLSRQNTEEFVNNLKEIRRQRICSEKKFEEKRIVRVGLRNHWIKDVSKDIADQLAMFVVGVLLSNRTDRTKRLKERILDHLCKMTGENTTAESATTRVERTMVVVADRMAKWIDEALSQIEQKTRCEHDIISLPSIKSEDTVSSIISSECEDEPAGQDFPMIPVVPYIPVCFDPYTFNQTPISAQLATGMERQSSQPEVPTTEDSLVIVKPGSLKKIEEVEEEEETDMKVQESETVQNKKPIEQTKEKEVEDNKMRESKDTAKKESRDKSKDKTKKENKVITKKESQEKSKKESQDKTKKGSQDKSKIEIQDKSKRESQDKTKKESKVKSNKESMDKTRNKIKDTTKEMRPKDEKKKGDKVKLLKENERKKKKDKDSEESDEDGTETDDEDVEESEPEVVSSEEGESGNETAGEEVESEEDQDKVEEEEVEAEEEEGEEEKEDGEVEKEEGQEEEEEDEEEEEEDDKEAKKKMKGLSKTPSLTEESVSLMSSTEVKAFTDTLDLLKEDVKRIPKGESKSERQRTIKEIIDERFKNIAKEKIPKSLDTILRYNIDETASEVADWVENILLSADNLPKPSSMPSLVNHGSAFEIKRGEGSKYEAIKLSYSTVAQKVADLRGVELPVRKRKYIPKTISPMNVKSTKDWAEWALGAANMGEKWGDWLDNKVLEIERRLDNRGPKAPQGSYLSSWTDWRNTAEQEAQKWRTENKRLKDEGNLWKRKLQKEPANVTEKETKALTY